jgi:hypothetical protein
MPRKRTTVQLSEDGERRLEYWTARLKKSQTEIFELSLAHFDGTGRRDLPVYITDPPPTRASNGGDHAA